LGTGALSSWVNPLKTIGRQEVPERMSPASEAMVAAVAHHCARSSPRNHSVIKISLSALRSSAFSERLAYKTTGASRRQKHADKTSIDDLVRDGSAGAFHTFAGGIPKVIHQTWKSKADLDDGERHSVDKWASDNPSFRYIFWEDADVNYFMSQYAPKDDSAMLASMRNIERFDYFRYLVLSKIGGVYNDIDVSPVLPLDQWRVPDDTTLICGWESRLKDDEEKLNVKFARINQLEQWTIASAPGHPVLSDVLGRIKANFLAGDTYNVITYTGPGVWTDAVLSYIGEPQERTDYGCDASNDWANKGVAILNKAAFAKNGYSGEKDCDGQSYVSHSFKCSWCK